jgi:hypothetical protein
MRQISSGIPSALFLHAESLHCRGAEAEASCAWRPRERGVPSHFIVRSFRIRSAFLLSCFPRCLASAKLGHANGSFPLMPAD